MKPASTVPGSTRSRSGNLPALPAILAVGAFLLALFVTWILVAQYLYASLFGPEPPESLSVFLSQIFGTTAGWTLIVLGNLIGFCFAVVVLATTVVAFPLLLDRDVGAVSALETSLRATMTNPVPVAFWGLIVAICLVIGTIPVFAGLAVMMPILGHATWHLYRKLVVAGDVTTGSRWTAMRRAGHGRWRLRVGSGIKHIASEPNLTENRVKSVSRGLLKAIVRSFAQL